MGTRWLPGLLVLVGACTGTLGEPGAQGDGTRGPHGRPAGDGPRGGDGDRGEDGGGGGPAGDGDGPGAQGDGDALEERAAPEPRFARLTHAQWQNSVLDLLHLDDPALPTTMLRDDPKQGGYVFDNDSSALVVDAALWQGYQQAAAQLADHVTADQARLTRLAPAAGDAAARRDAFLERFGLRAHRRPLGDEELAGYRTLFDAGKDLYAGMADFDAGVRAVVEAALQTPMFVYRVELSQTEVDGAIPLDGYEVASRMSYFLWNTMPDDALFTAAEDGSLATRAGVQEQVQRLLADGRATATVEAFHAQLLETDKVRGVQPSPDHYAVSPQLGDHAVEEQRRFVAHVYENDGSFSTLLTSPETFVNAELADIYGVMGDFDDRFQRVTLDDRERRGLFTQVAFLAGNATSVDPDPIHRGKFLAERITCKHITAPPTNVPAPPAVSDKTNRQRIADYTEMPGSACASCHATLINPFGFPFESYDAVGAHRDTDRGQPVDTQASPVLDGMPTPVADAVELAERLASSEETHGCYVQHWLELAHGRHVHENDEGQIASLTRMSLEDDASLVELLSALVLSDAFLTRSPEEAP